MNKRKMTVFAVLSAVLLTSAIFVVFFASTVVGESSRPIILPPAVSGGQADEITGIYNPDIPRPAIDFVGVDRDNFKTLIESLDRPESYSADYNIDIHWDGGHVTLLRKLWVLKDLCKVTRYGPDGLEAETIILYGGLNYIWDLDETEYKMIRSGEITTDNDLQVPTYEDLLKLAETDIISAEYLDYDSESCLKVTFEDRDGGLARIFWISLDRGVLIHAETYRGTDIIYSCSISNLDYTIPDYTIFKLPDGSGVRAQEGLPEQA